MSNNNLKEKIKDIIEFDSQESNIDIIELLTDLPYNMELADSLDISLQDLVTITSELEKEYKTKNDLLLSNMEQAFYNSNRKYYANDIENVYKRIYYWTNIYNNLCISNIKK